MYKAYGATVFSFGPFSALYFMFYETIKGYFVINDVSRYLNKVDQVGNSGKKDSHSIDISFGHSLLCSMLAGAMASTLTNPLDMVKLRL